MSDSDDDVPQLSKETLAALIEFYAEKEQEAEEERNLSENWQLSQFWYDERTTEYLANLACQVAGTKGNIALISCPTLYPAIKSRITENNRVCLLEYDERFSVYGNDFIPYDYKSPLNIPKEFADNFEVVVVDPPFLSEECLTNTAETVKFLTTRNVVLCTGATMEDLAMKLLDVKKTSFKPTHKNNLANEFHCYTNFEIKDS